LKTSDRQPQCSIKFAKLSRGLGAHKAISPHELAHHGSILLFHKALVVFHLRTATRKGDPFSFALTHDRFIDKLASSIGIQTQDRKRKTLTRLLEGHKNGFWALREERETLGPAGGDVSQRQGGEKAPMYVSTVMAHQISFQKARLGIIPLSKRAHGNLLFEQGSGLCRGKRTWSWLTL
jgi:hypothetical protein